MKEVKQKAVDKPALKNKHKKGRKNGI